MFKKGEDDIASFLFLCWNEGLFLGYNIIYDLWIKNIFATKALKH